MYTEEVRQEIRELVDGAARSLLKSRRQIAAAMELCGESWELSSVHESTGDLLMALTRESTLWLPAEVYAEIVADTVRVHPSRR